MCKGPEVGGSCTPRRKRGVAGGQERVRREEGWPAEARSQKAEPPRGLVFNLRVAGAGVTFIHSNTSAWHCSRQTPMPALVELTVSEKRQSTTLEVGYVVSQREAYRGGGQGREKVRLLGG